MTSATFNLEFCIRINLTLTSCTLKEIIRSFKNAIGQVFQELVTEALIYFASRYKDNGYLSAIFGSSEIIWKSSKGFRLTTIHTIFGKIRVPQLQIKDKKTGKKHYITRFLLGIEPRKRIPQCTKEAWALTGALAPYRVAAKIISIFSGFKPTLMNIFRAVRSVGKEITFAVDPTESNVFEADGTGVPILKASKRGKELKILAQRKKTRGIRIAGIHLDHYKKGWGKLFSAIKEHIKVLGKVIIVTDGDVSILKGLGKKVSVIIQRCLWHIPHEVKYTLWRDKVKKKSAIWIKVLSEILDICRIRRITDEKDETVLNRIIKMKLKALDKLIVYCREQKLTHTATFLQNCRGDLFSGVRRKIKGGTISLIERVMQTINQRINVGIWGHDGALCVAKIRAAYYYNGFDIE
jgi:hypothetical protein